MRLVQLPSVIPIDGTVMGNILGQLTGIRAKLGNIGSGDWTKVLLDYQSWASSSAETLGFYFDHEDVGRLIMTRRHWWLMDQAATFEPRDLGPVVHYAFRAEQADRLRVLDSLISKYNEIELVWGKSHDLFVVPDTNFFLMHKAIFDEADWETIIPRFSGETVRIIVPIAVIRELDRQKIVGKNIRVGKDETVASRARNTVRTLNEMFDRLDMPATPIPGVRVELLLDPLRHQPMTRVDGEIIERALVLKRVSGKDVTLLTRDLSMKLVAGTEGLKVLDDSVSTP